MKKLLGIIVLGLLLISNIAGAKTKNIGNGLKINIPKQYKHFEIDLKKIMSAFPIIKEMIDEDEIDKDEFESFGIGPKAKLLIFQPALLQTILIIFHNHFFYNIFQHIHL